MHTISEQLTSDQLSILLVAYCISGCDTCSFFYGKGKRTIFKLVIQKPYVFQNCDRDFQACINFVSVLYGHSDLKLHEIRCLKARKSTNPRQLPPTENSLYQHYLRCTYQLLVWRNATTALCSLPPPTEYGYEMTASGELIPTTMTQSLGAPELLNDMICRCGLCDYKCVCIERPTMHICMRL